MSAPHHSAPLRHGHLPPTPLSPPPRAARHLLRPPCALHPAPRPISVPIPYPLLRPPPPAFPLLPRRRRRRWGSNRRALRLRPRSPVPASSNLIIIACVPLLAQLRLTSPDRLTRTLCLSGTLAQGRGQGQRRSGGSWGAEVRAAGVHRRARVLPRGEFGDRIATAAFDLCALMTMMCGCQVFDVLFAVSLTGEWTA